MASPQEIVRSDKTLLEEEIVVHYERLCFSRDCGDKTAEELAEIGMNESLDEYSDVLKALGRLSLNTS